VKKYRKEKKKIGKRKGNSKREKGKKNKWAQTT
jgi:hypothetical protein